jgi:hypothetical protein
MPTVSINSVCQQCKSTLSTARRGPCRSLPRDHCQRGRGLTAIRQAKTWQASNSNSAGCGRRIPALRTRGRPGSRPLFKRRRNPYRIGQPATPITAEPGSACLARALARPPWRPGMPTSSRRRTLSADPAAAPSRVRAKYQTRLTAKQTTQRSVHKAVAGQHKPGTAANSAVLSAKW